MTYSDIKKHLMDGTTEPFYIFTGEEFEVQRAYINRIAQSKNQIVKRVDTIAEATKGRSGGLLGQSVCYVCRDDSDFQKNESAWDKIETLLNGNTLIYQITKIDKRSKFYTTYEHKIVTFDHMTEQVLIKHIREHIDLSVTNCKELIRICENDYGRILSEIDKIEQFVRSDVTVDGVLYDGAFVHLVNDGTLYRPPEDAIFKWVDAVISGKPNLSFKLWQECVDIGEPTLRLLLVLYQGVRRLLQVQSCPTSNVTEVTGLTQWEIGLVKNYQNIYSNGELVNAMRNIKSLETAIKTGEVDEEFAVPYAMVSLLGE